ncbi:MAG: ABC transporter substrate-binding protein, partial [Elusimicrobiota bacterium]
MKRLFFLFLLLISGSCTNERSKEGFVSLSPAATEIVYMLGARDSLKGVSDYCDRPPRAKEKPSAGGIINPSIEKIISLSPETVFIMPGLPGEIFRKIEKAGINTIELKSEGIEDIFLAVEKIARLCGKTARGDE